MGVHVPGARRRDTVTSDGALPLLDADRGGFVQRHDLWGDAEYAAAAQIRRIVDEHGIELVRAVFCDQHGVPRGKTFARDAFWSVLKGGCTAPSSLLLKDTSGRSVYPVFSPGGGIGVPGLGGAGDLVLVPDPKTFRVLPWASRTGWVLCDLHFSDGTPVPLSPRHVGRRALARLADRGYDLVVGVELEFQVFRDADPAPLTPALALDYLHALSADLLAAVVLDANGELLAGPQTLAAPARALLHTAPQATLLAGSTPDGAAYAGRDARHAIVAATGPHALPRLARHDLCTALAALGGGTAVDAAPARVPPAVVEALLSAVSAS